jgi:hypothetical protein
MTDRREKPVDQDVPTLFYSDSPSVSFSKLPEGQMNVRSNSIDGERKVVPAGGALLVTLGPKGVEARIYGTAEGSDPRLAQDTPPSPDEQRKAWIRKHGLVAYLNGGAGWDEEEPLSESGTTDFTDHTD